MKRYNAGEKKKVSMYRSSKKEGRTQPVLIFITSLWESCGIIFMVNSKVSSFEKTAKIHELLSRSLCFV